MDENRAWTAKWIWAEPSHNSGPANGSMETVLFRRSFGIPANESVKLKLLVSADSRFRLYVNGQPVAYGPCKGDLNVHYYDEVDVTPHLRPGTNVLAAQVVHYSGDKGPASVWRKERGVFLLEGSLQGLDGRVIERLDTGCEGWRCYPVPGESAKLAPETATLFIGGGEIVDGAGWPRGWRDSAFAEGWPAASVVADTHDKMYGGLSSWLLTPRPIPFMKEEIREFASIVRGHCGERIWLDEPMGPGGKLGIEVAAGSRLVLELHAGELVAGFPQLAVSGGAGAAASILYSECYEYEPLPNGQRNKGVRDDPDGKSLHGFEDTYRIAGYGSGAGEPEKYEPFHRRAFRFVRLTVEAAEEPVMVEGITYLRTGYPLDAKASFASSDPSLSPLWTISLNTLRNCMHETYEDTPYYEQMQYEMDSRLQALFTYYISGDDRLGRKAIYDFHSSLLPTGMLQSRYPSVNRQIIPGFALFWIMMVHDHYWYSGDLAHAARYRPTIDAVLAWFEARVEPESGLIGVMPEAYWSFVDWTEEWRRNAGAPPSGRTRPNTVYNLMAADALLKAAELNEATGRRDTGQEYRRRAAALQQAIRQHCWSEEKGLFTDSPDSPDALSQHAQIWAVLTDTVAGEKARQLMLRALETQGLAKVSSAMAYYLFRALAKTGMYDRTFALWGDWKAQVDLHLTSWVEDPVSVRSDCHAWGALPLHEFPAELLGVQPLTPGFATISVAPRIGALQAASGAVITPYGAVKIEWSIREARFRLRVERPGAIPVQITLPNGEPRYCTGAGPLECECELTTIEPSEELKP
ncbi:alpha-L-rhamnosidase-like protein [Paenibacillus sp. BK033]|uniref:alpha-L-rhamnosidase-related protein n=1 Tax=Paenibacillus sp. BK033 TaxID=2512133 RepID=UPI00104CD87E|nr:alpha-L-rhamnosidase C-terminal domain-containing protein [Paenibacillus sp. BK033]TCM97059.1 alpha-L-rhamnosidase-like protein [Paenibacillus sp. BK033]